MTADTGRSQPQRVGGRGHTLSEGGGVFAEKRPWAKLSLWYLSQKQTFDFTDHLKGLSLISYM